MTALLGMATSARAEDVARVGLGSSFGSLVASPDGGVWVEVDRSLAGLAAHPPADWDDAIGRAGPDHRYRQAPVKGSLLVAAAALGPDGQAWFPALTTLFRSDTAGNVTRTPLSEVVANVAAPGPDGTLWSLPSLLPPDLLRVDARGTVTKTPFTLPGCEGPTFFSDMTRAADGQVWAAEWACQRLIRIAPDGTPATAAQLPAKSRPVHLAADAAGGVWFSDLGDDSALGHVDAAGARQRFPLPGRHGRVLGIAVAPDGAAYLAFGRCELGRVAPDGTTTFGPAPVPAKSLAFDPQGGLWLESPNRLVHAPAPPAERGTCDDKPPAVRLSPGLRRTVRLGQLRRGIRISVREPAMISAAGDYGDDDHDARLKIVRAAHGGSLVFRLPKAVLRTFERRLKAGRKAAVSLFVEAYDREGNVGGADREEVRVIPDAKR